MTEEKCPECHQDDYEHSPSCKQLQQVKNCPDCGQPMNVVYKYDEYYESYKPLAKPKKVKVGKLEWIEMYEIDHQSDIINEASSAWFTCKNFCEDEGACIIDGIYYKDGKPINPEEIP